MPIYEYRCRSCNKVFEAIQRFGDRPLRKCTECGGRLDKLVSRTAFQFKGGGWFSEGYSKNNSKNVSSDAPGKATDSSSTSETKPKKPASSGKD